MNSRQISDKESTWQRACLLGGLIIGLIALAIAWRWTALGEYLDVNKSVAMLRSSEFIQMPIVAVTVVFIASITAVPLSVIIVIAAVTYGSFLGPIYVMTGAEIGAAMSFALGKYLGHNALIAFAGEKVSLLSQQLGKKGITSVFLVRLVPAAPFAIVNMVAGASHIRMRDFIAGTAFGMVPGVIMITLFVDQILANIIVPSWRVIFLVLAFIVVILGVIKTLTYYLKKSRN